MIGKFNEGVRSGVFNALLSRFLSKVTIGLVWTGQTQHTAFKVVSSAGAFGCIFCNLCHEVSLESSQNLA